MPAVSGIPVTHRGVTHEFTVVSGHIPPAHPDSLINWEALAQLRGTLVLLMAVENLPAIAERLIANGKDRRDAGRGNRRWHPSGSAEGDLRPGRDRRSDDRRRRRRPRDRCHRQRSGGRGQGIGRGGGRRRHEPLVTLEDPADERLADYVQLREVNLRRLLEEEHGLFIAEGDKVIRRAADAGYEPRSFLLAPRWLDSLADVLEKWPEHRCTSCPRSWPSRSPASTCTAAPWRRTGAARGVLAICSTRGRRIAISTTSSTTRSRRRIPRGGRDGVELVLVTPTCADPLYRRSIKVSMGTVFQVPWTRLTSWPGDLGPPAGPGFVAAALALTDDSITLDELAARQDERLALIFGTEGHGLKPHVLDQADLTVRIPMSGGSTP